MGLASLGNPVSAGVKGLDPGMRARKPDQTEIVIGPNYVDAPEIAVIGPKKTPGNGSIACCANEP